MKKARDYCQTLMTDYSKWRAFISHIFPGELSGIIIAGISVRSPSWSSWEGNGTIHVHISHNSLKVPIRFFNEPSLGTLKVFNWMMKVMFSRRNATMISQQCMVYCQRVLITRNLKQSWIELSPEDSVQIFTYVS